MFIGEHKGEYLGCFKDDRNRRILTGLQKELKEDNSPQKCISLCFMSGKLSIWARGLKKVLRSLLVGGK